jgi:hypothetical protein
MVYAEIKNKRDTLVLGFPRNAADMQIKLSSIGIHKNVKDIPLSVQESDGIRVRLYTESNIWNHFIRMFSGNESLADVNEAVWAVLKADEAVKTELEQNILHDQYDSVPELLKDIEEMTVLAGRYAESFYFPLKGMLDGDEYEDCYEIDHRFLLEYKDDIREAVEGEQSIGDMAQFFNRSESVKEKLASIVWSVDEVDGKLYGCVNVRLKEPLTEGETEILKEWISGQNSDGLGEGFEQRAVEIEEGDLYVSFWHSGDDYFVYSQEEMDAYIHEQREMWMGGM